MNLFKSKSRSGFEPWYEDIMKNMVTGGDGITGIKDLAKKGPAEYYSKDTVADLTPSQLADLTRIRTQGISAAGPSGVLGKAESQLGDIYSASGELAGSSVRNAMQTQDAVNKQAGELSRYGTGLMSYGTDATKTGLSQEQYAGYTPFQKAQLESMLAGDVDATNLQAMQDATARQGLRALRPNLAAIRARTGSYQRGGGSGSEKDRRLTEEAYTQQMADTWAPLAHQSFEAAQGRRLPAGQLALSAQLAAQQLGTQGAGIGQGAGNLMLGGGQLAQQGYGTAIGARQLGLNAAQAAPGIAGAQSQMLQNALQTGNIRQGQQQAEIDADRDKWNYEQNAEAMHLRNLLGLMGGARVPTIGRGRPSALDALLGIGKTVSGFY